MNKYLKIAVAVIGLSFGVLEAVNAQQCATDVFYKEQLKKNPQLAKAAEDFENYAKSYINNNASSKKGQRTTTVTKKRVIPVVFHILHQWGGENIEKKWCVQQISGMNKGYANADTTPYYANAMNCYSAFRDVVANCNIEFRLATKDPYGNHTDGIDRIATYYTNNNGGDTIYRDALKSVVDWDSKKYLNIWVVQSIISAPNTPGVTLGYAQFPWQRQSSPNTDGIVVYYGAVGQTPPGGLGSYRVLTHEAGHWLSLIHIWGDAVCGNDGVDDTPTHHNVNFSTAPSFPSLLDTMCISPILDSVKCVKDSVVKSAKTGKDTILCANKCRHSRSVFQLRQGKAVDTIYCVKMDTLVLSAGLRNAKSMQIYKESIGSLKGEMYINYMDYTAQELQIMFSKGQLARMDATLDTSGNLRPSIITQANLLATGTDDASYPTASKIGGKPKAYYYVNNNYINSKVGVCSGSSLTFKDSSTNGHVQSRVWSFPGGTPSSSTAQVVSVTYNTPGLYDASLIVQNANGSDTLINKGSVYVYANGSAWYNINFKEDFESPYYSDQGWTVIDGKNNYNDSVSWKKTNITSFSGNSCMVLKNYDNHHTSKGDVDELISPTIQIAAGTNPTLVFYTSFAKKISACTSVLKVMYSADCGNTWAPIKTISANALANAGVSASEFIPQQSFLWAKQSLPLDGSAGSINLLGKNVRIKFRFESNSGLYKTYPAAAEPNNLFLDNIYFTGSVGLEEKMAANLNVGLYPNPTANETNLTFNLDRETATNISLCDITGRVLNVIADEKLGSGEHQFTISNKFGAGVYILKLKTGEIETVKKLIFN